MWYRRTTSSMLTPLFVGSVWSGKFWSFDLPVLPGRGSFPSNFFFSSAEHPLNGKADGAAFQQQKCLSVYAANQFITVVECDAMRQSRTSQCIRWMQFSRVFYSALRFLHCYNDLIFLENKLYHFIWYISFFAAAQFKIIQ